MRRQQDLRQAIEQARADSARLEALHKRQEQVRQEQEELNKQVTQQAEARARAQAGLEAARQAEEQSRRQLPEAYPTAQALKTALERLETERAVLQQQAEQAAQAHARADSGQQRLEGRRTELEARQAQWQAAQEAAQAAYLDKCRRLGFGDGGEAIAAKRSAQERAALRQELEAYDRACRETAAQIARLTEETQGRRADIQAAADALAAAAQREEELRRLAETGRARLDANRRILRELEELLDRLGRLWPRYQVTDRLARVAGGTASGIQKVRFETYVMGRYLDQILRQANRRFTRMTNNRYSLMRNDFDAGLNRRGLELGVLDRYTGKPRDVRTLSGGESFKAALSLALGLSDVVQRQAGGISIDTMFVDEGFGSLDAESLDAAVETLLSLAGDDRMVGIISHVGELKERIDKKIVVSRSPRGSTVRVEV